MQVERKERWVQLASDEFQQVLRQRCLHDAIQAWDIPFSLQKVGTCVPYCNSELVTNT